VVPVFAPPHLVIRPSLYEIKSQNEIRNNDESPTASQDDGLCPLRGQCDSGVKWVQIQVLEISGSIRMGIWAVKLFSCVGPGTTQRGYLHGPSLGAK
jgi:hypothetical protein